MSDEEHAIADQRGTFAQVVADGDKVPDLEWQEGRLVLSNRRLVLAAPGGKKTIPLSAVRSITSREGVNEATAPVDNYLSVQADRDVMLISPFDQDTFEYALFGAILDQQVVYARHPAVAGGVVQETDWEKGRLKVEADEVALAIASGQFVEIDLEDVGTVELGEAEVDDGTRRVVRVEHADDDTAVRTDVAGVSRHVAVLASLLRKGEERNATDVELSDEEREVLLALHSGVSPFQIPEFTGLDVDRVEELFDDLVEDGFLESVRTHRSVSLKARGRHIASEAMDEE